MGFFFGGGGVLKFQIFLGEFEVPDIWGGGAKGRCWARDYV